MNRLSAAEAVQRMQDYIEAHLGEPVTLKQLARAAGYSPYHCARLFRELTGKTPFHYLRARRLTQAALTLRDEKTRVVDVAFDFVFDSHEGFTKAFSRQFGISPMRYAKEIPPIRLFLPYGVLTYYRHIHKEEEKEMEQNAVFVQVVERPKRKALVKRGVKATDYFEYCEEVGCDVWGVLLSVKEALYEPVGMWLPENLRRPGTSEYVQGVEVPFDYDKPVPEGFGLMELAPCKLMVFQGPPYDDEHFGDAIQALWTQIERYDPKLYGYTWADGDGPRIQLEPQGYRGYIEARPVREANAKG
ncbi:MAG: helix-turn-helix domain-containing protein [Clostridiaceae bacterium]